MISNSWSSSSLERPVRLSVGEQVERDDADAELVAPAEELAHLLGAGAVAVRRASRARARAPSGGCRR